MYELPVITRKKPRPAYRKSDAVKQLEALANAAQQEKHPSIEVKYLSPFTFRDDSANRMTGCITKYIELKGGMASRINTIGVWDQKRSKYRVSTQKRGLADIWATYKGLSLQIEVKIKDKQSEYQVKVQQQQTAAGGLYFVARDFESFKTWFDSI